MGEFCTNPQQKNASIPSKSLKPQQTGPFLLFSWKDMRDGAQMEKWQTCLERVIPACGVLCVVMRYQWEISGSSAVDFGGVRSAV